MKELQQGCIVKDLKGVERIWGRYPKDTNNFKIILSIGYDLRRKIPLLIKKNILKYQLLLMEQCVKLTNIALNL